MVSCFLLLLLEMGGTNSQIAQLVNTENKYPNLGILSRSYWHPSLV
jgi:hypothetical protein